MELMTNVAKSHIYTAMTKYYSAVFDNYKMLPFSRVFYSRTALFIFHTGTKVVCFKQQLYRVNENDKQTATNTLYNPKLASKSQMLKIGN